MREGECLWHRSIDRKLNKRNLIRVLTGLGYVLMKLRTVKPNNGQARGRAFRPL